MIVTASIDTIRKWIRGDGGSPPTNIAVGVGTTAPAITDTAMTDEIYPTTSRNACTITNSENVVHYYMTQATDEGSTSTYAEQGLFSNSTTGTIFSRQTHPDIKKDNTVIMDSIIGVEVSSYLP